MNALPRTTAPQTDWVINYVEVNSQPTIAGEFRLLRITGSELRIDPAGIVLSIGPAANEREIQLQCGSESYSCTIVQRGSELIVRINRCNSIGDIMIVAKRAVSKFAPSFPQTDQVESAQTLNSETLTFF